jgi:magnesium chelatase subunit D
MTAADDSGHHRLPFSAVVGLDQAKLALLLAACEPRLGGVLLRGDKGSAKTTLARGLAALLPGDAPFVELPLGATEDRVIGSIDAGELLTSGAVRVRPGLLQAAHGGVLYVDEINLLADHLVDALLDAAVSGVNRIERDGISHEHPARFVLIGSMNPEEGDLRPQLLDRFGLAVDITTPDAPAIRAGAVRRQLDAERGSGSMTEFADLDGELRRRVTAWRPSVIADDIIELASSVAVAVGAEGLRADLMLSRAAAALAGWDGREVSTADDVRTVAPLVLGHRARRQPFDDPGLTDDEINDAFADQQPDEGDQGDEAAGGARPPGGDGRQPTPPGRERRAASLPTVAPRARPADRGGRRDPTGGQRGRFVRDAPAGDVADAIAIVPTAVTAARRRAAEPDVAIRRSDLRVSVREDRTGRLIVFVVDTSGSMGADQRLATAKGAVLGLLTDAYQQRDRVALVVFGGETAEVALRPTGSVEIARARLDALPLGGATPLAAGIDAAHDVVRRAVSQHDLAPTVVLITDGHATSGGDDPVEGARSAAARLAGAGVAALVINAEDGIVGLGLADELATILGAECLTLAGLEPTALVQHLRGGS